MRLAGGGLGELSLAESAAMSALLSGVTLVEDASSLAVLSLSVEVILTAELLVAEVTLPDVPLAGLSDTNPESEELPLRLLSFPEEADASGASVLGPGCVLCTSEHALTAGEWQQQCHGSAS